MGCAQSAEEVEYDPNLYSAPVDWENHEEGTLTVSGGPAEGREIFYRGWVPKGPVKAYMFAIHGLHEHSGRFTSFAHFLTKSGIAVWAADYYSHGRSGGTPGLLPVMEWLYEDQIQFIQATLKRTGFQGPLLLHAHSLGSLIAIHVVTILPERDPSISFRSLSITGAALDAGPAAASPFGLECLYCLIHTGAFARGLMCCMGTIAPTAPNAPIKEEGLTSDAEELAIYRRDPYIFRGEIMNRTAHTCLQLTASARARVPLLRLPVYLVHGEDDRVTLPSGSGYIYEHASTEDKDKHILLLAGARHEVMHEREDTRNRAMETLKEFHIQLL